MNTDISLYQIYIQILNEIILIYYCLNLFKKNFLGLNHSLQTILKSSVTLSSSLLVWFGKWYQYSFLNFIFWVAGILLVYWSNARHTFSSRVLQPVEFTYQILRALFLRKFSHNHNWVLLPFCHSAESFCQTRGLTASTLSILVSTIFIMTKSDGAAE